MGAFIGVGDIGIWTSNGARDAFLDWFAEFRCVPQDARWQWCKSPAHRWQGCGLELTELLHEGEVFHATDADRSYLTQTYSSTVVQLVMHIEAIWHGEWTYRIDSPQAVNWPGTL